MSSEYPGHAVLDSGATESIASLEALEEVMLLRGRAHGPERVVVHQQEKRFRFGNGTYQKAVSFVEVPQVINGQHVPQSFLDQGLSAIRIALPAFDLSTNKGSSELNFMIQKHRPRLLWFSLPCGPYSLIQSLFNQKSEDQLAKSLERKRKARKLIRNGIKAARLHLDLGGGFA